MSIKEIIAGGVITVVIGGTAYTVNQEDVVNNFAADTGVSQQQAEEYVKGLDESDLASFTEIGDSFITDGNQILSYSKTIDCLNYKYPWESPTLSCNIGKSQLTKLGSDEISLGNSYKSLDTDSSSATNMNSTIISIDTVNTDYGMEIVSKILTVSEIDETKKSNSYNKSLLQAALKNPQ